MIKFVIVGTSKSNDDCLYYSKERLKIWGSLHLAGVTSEYWQSEDEFRKKGTKDFANKHGFDFYDVLPLIESSDKLLLNKLSAIEQHKTAQISAEVRQKSNSTFNSLLFNGKTSFYYFSYFYLNEYFDIKNFKSHVKRIKKMFEKENVIYGKMTSNVSTRIFNSNQIKNIFILPNTSGRISGKPFDEFIWIKSIKESMEFEL
jgi:hypothetical protein